MRIAQRVASSKLDLIKQPFVSTLTDAMFCQKLLIVKQSLLYDNQQSHRGGYCQKRFDSHQKEKGIDIADRNVEVIEVES